MKQETLNKIMGVTKEWKKEVIFRHYFMSGYLKKAAAFYSEVEGRSAYKFRVSNSEESFIIFCDKVYMGAVKEEIQEMFPGYSVDLI